MSEERRTSPWVYVGIGCGVVVVLVIVVVVGVGFWGYRMVKRVESDMKDPAIRAEKVKSVLGCSELPEGYKAYMSLSIPWIMDMAILSDREPEAGKKSAPPFDHRGFIYVKALRGNNEKKLRDFIDGKVDASELLGRGNINLESGEQIGRGTIKLADMTLHYAASRGAISVKGKRLEGLATVMFIECPGDTKFRMGVLFGPDPISGRTEDRGAAEDKPSEPARTEPDGKQHAAEPESEGSGKTAAPADYKGTTADESEIRAFMSHFAPCGV